ncbi:hypothetical protein AAGT00_12920 [Streptomyces cavourensis]
MIASLVALLPTAGTHTSTLYADWAAAHDPGAAGAARDLTTDMGSELARSGTKPGRFVDRMAARERQLPPARRRRRSPAGSGGRRRRPPPPDTDPAVRWPPASASCSSTTSAGRWRPPSRSGWRGWAARQGGEIRAGYQAVASLAFAVLLLRAPASAAPASPPATPVQPSTPDTTAGEPTP